MKALDLFCGAGGASMGLHRAGFDVTGVDIESQPRYPFTFHQLDALECDWAAMDYDFVWASPPCQKFTAYKRRPNHVAPRENLIPQTRELLKAAGVPYVIENIPGAPLKNTFQLCGSSFGLDVRRHRIFEASFKVTPPACNHSWQTPRFPPASNRKNLRRTVEVGVWRIPLETQRKAMGIEWMNLEELSEAVPPAYSHFIATQFLNTEGLAGCFDEAQK